jgi:uncharacterized protein
VSPEVVAEIQERLNSIKRTQAVSIPLAIESGSRAWGFPSPDSDYDCRFVFIRSRRDSSRLFTLRDVIETPLTPVFDVNGWELAKALKLMLKGNAVILEWLQSPFRYMHDEDFVALLSAFATQAFRADAVAKHYYHMLKNQVARTVADGDEISVKKTFYLLRPAMALTYLRTHRDARGLPMNFQQLRDGVLLDARLRETIDDLLEKKSVTRELGTATAPVSVMDFVRHELAAGEAMLSSKSRENKKVKQAAEELYQQLLTDFAPR